jgi:hypothetical protein
MASAVRKRVRNVSYKTPDSVESHGHLLHRPYAYLLLLIEAERQPSAAAGSGSGADAEGSQLQGVVRRKLWQGHEAPSQPDDFSVSLCL